MDYSCFATLFTKMLTSCQTLEMHLMNHLFEWDSRAIHCWKRMLQCRKILSASLIFT
ncbi:hypothetical protein L917_02678 [Phytophthora nicotianae]|uniref:Uncharacterized protein n=1 Tax=Phytophthora nicotianae TaxID=4792 RepID=W2LVD0_PHYNI|nr:hypothetical protein L917_02678 [Phytophthora nicotianae]